MNFLTCMLHQQDEMDVAPEKGQAFSINFGPPAGDDDY